MVTGKFHCKRCSRDFSMAAHLARHNSTIHSTGKKAAKKKGGAKKKSSARKKGTAKRAKKKGTRGPGRPKGSGGGVSALRGMTLEQLCQLIDNARAEAQRKLASLAKSLK